ncbi:MAG: peptidylprolyl isomerase [Candidatus Sumerlaeota bacterium]
MGIAAAQEETADQPDNENEAGEAAELKTVKPRVKVETTLGEFIIQLDAEQAPVTVQNFLTYVDEGFYDGTIFHRVIPDFVAQGGGFTENNEKKTKGLHEPIKNEWLNGRSHLRSTVAMARQGGKPGSAQAQFFINLQDNSRLNLPQPDGAGYANFGHVISGMDVIEKIAEVDRVKNPQTSSNQPTLPEEPVVIKKMTMLDEIDIKKIAETVKAQEEAKIKKIRRVFPELEEEFEIEIPELKERSSGLMYAVVREGTGKRPKPSSVVKVHYKGVLLDGTEFDNSYKRGEPTQFSLNQVIKGWTQGVQLVKEGGMIVLVTPPELAYGDQERPGMPANSTLVFLVELVEIANPAQAQ